MAETMTKLEHVPDWIMSIYDKINTLVFAGAFTFTPGVELIFGSETSRGAGEMKVFPSQSTVPSLTGHEIFAVCSGNG